MKQMSKLKRIASLSFPALNIRYCSCFCTFDFEMVLRRHLVTLFLPFCSFCPKVSYSNGQQLCIPIPFSEVMKNGFLKKNLPAVAQYVGKIPEIMMSLNVLAAECIYRTMQKDNDIPLKLLQNSLFGGIRNPTLK